ncbi:MAG: class I SAM-dependent methyltransferase [Thermoanaerobaculia bacterium]|nr:class I SAM-dependent methyltransferase [Thermoanaerobaculia bacterium]
MNTLKPIDRSFRLPRVWSNQILRTIAPVFRGEVINVSGWDDRDKEGSEYRDYFCNASAYYLSNYEGKRGVADAEHKTDFCLDLTTDTLPDKLHQRFDVAFCHTVLEHVFALDTAFGNLAAMSRDGVIVVVPFAQELHYTDDYGDYWRFTPQGLRSMFAKFGFQVVYEAANDHVNAGLYILMIGSKRKPAWVTELPHWEPVTHLGSWLGHSERKPPRWKRLRRIARGAKARWIALTTSSE